MYDVWVVERETQSPMKKVATFDCAEEAFVMGGKMIKGLGGAAIRVTNTLWSDDLSLTPPLASLLMVDPTDVLTKIGIVVHGAQLCEDASAEVPVLTEMTEYLTTVH